MLTSSDFKLGCDCDTSKMISHFDKYSKATYPHQRFTKAGSTTKVFRSWIARRYDHDAGTKLFQEYIEWYKSKLGSYKGAWYSWIRFTRTDFDLLFGYKNHEYLIRVPIIVELFENRILNSMYIHNVREAIYADLRRGHRFSYLEEDYGVNVGVIGDLVKVRFKHLLKVIKQKHTDDVAPSYSDLRCLRFMYEQYGWVTALKLVNDTKFKLLSSVIKVRRFGNLKSKSYRELVKPTVETVNDSIDIKGDVSDISADIWKTFHERMKE